MSVELEAIRDFLVGFDPFSHLPGPELDRLAGAMTMTYERRGTEVFRAGEVNDQLWVIRSGAVDILDDTGVLLDRREVGRSFGYSTLVGEPESLYSAVTVEDSLLLALPRAEFERIARENPEFERSYAGKSARIKAAARTLQQPTANTEVLRMALGEFAIRTPAQVEPGASIQEAAARMVERNVSSLLILGASGHLEGIVTDRDLRSCVARGADVTLPVADIMARTLITATEQTLVFEAMMLLTEHQIHHLPVLEYAGGPVTGIVASADIMRLLQNNPIYLTADLARRDSPGQMREVHDAAHRVALNFIDRGAQPAEVMGLLTVVADAMARRLIHLAEEKLGPPPVPYAFVVLGSQGRREMGLASDQDNALVLHDSYEEQAHGRYFEELSEFVCRGLAVAGQPLCPGDMMAMNPQWRMTQSQWAATFHQWITAPTPDALLYAQTFFDMRAVHGDLALAEYVHKQAVASAKNSPRLHAHLAGLTAHREPPLGFFRGFVVERSGEYRNTLNVKKGGTHAIVQFARLAAITQGVEAVGTVERLKAVAGTPAASASAVEDLLSSFAFLNSITLHHQDRQLRGQVATGEGNAGGDLSPGDRMPTPAGEPGAAPQEGPAVDYQLDPRALGKLERENLRDAFHIIKSMQNSLSIKYPTRSV